MYFKSLWRTGWALVLLLSTTLVRAGEVHVAVAANFTVAMKEIASGFENASGHRALLSFGSTGTLYAQIVHGAPYEVFLAADRRRPVLLHKNGFAGEPFTYAIGRLVLWSSDAERKVDEQALRDGDFRKLAIANPKTAPYGAAALQVMCRLGLYAQLKPKLVIGTNIAQAYQFVATGNAQVGFVALAQVALDGKGRRWEIPDSLYAPIRQDAVQLDRGDGNPAASAFIEYLMSDAAQAVIRKYGYATE
jgi:molybdate transport system substrate-binding protein